MKKIFLSIGIIILILFSALFLKAYIFVPEEFKNQENYVKNCPTQVFDKSAVIFDVLTICGTKNVTQTKLQHATHVAAQWLDNNQDGVADEPRLIESLKSNKPVVIMSENWFDMMTSTKIFTKLSSQNSLAQDLSATETKPSGDRRDASQEEIHHIIMNAGWIPLFPKVFSDQKSENSKLYRVWKYANDNKIYDYNDPTCNDACKVTEFVYLASAAYLGSSADLQSEELKLKNKKQLQESIPEIIEIFESENYVYPTTIWPNWDYLYSKNLVYY